MRASADPEPLGVCCLFKSFEAAYSVVRIARPLIEEVAPRDVVLRFFAELNELARAGPIDLSQKQVVVLEGLRGSGKSSIAAGLANTYEVSVVGGPPASVAAMLRFAAAGKLPRIVFRAIDLIACYFVAREAARASCAVVIVEGGFHRCCAEAVCWGSGDLCAGAELDDNGAPSSSRGRVIIDPTLASSALSQEVYRWPSDLPQPSLVSTASPRSLSPDSLTLLCLFRSFIWHLKLT
jgi:hypothetical protein